MKPKGAPVREEGKGKPTSGLSGSSVAEENLGRHGEPGSDEPRNPVDLHARIVARAHELYQRRGRHDGHALQDWLQAEGEIRGT